MNHAHAALQEQELLERQRGLERAVRRWENDLIAEGYTSNPEENERNIRALKARRVDLFEQSRRVSRAGKEIRQTRARSGSEDPGLWRRWIRVHHL